MSKVWRCSRRSRDGVFGQRDLEVRSRGPETQKGLEIQRDLEVWRS